MSDALLFLSVVPAVFIAGPAGRGLLANGGTLFCQSLLRMLAEEKIKVVHAVINVLNAELGADDFHAYPAERTYILNVKYTGGSRAGDLWRSLSGGLWTPAAFDRAALARSLREIITKHGLTALLLDYFYATHFLPPLPESPIKKMLMVINNEPLFYKETLFRKRSRIFRPDLWLKYFLFRAREKKTYRSFDKVVAIGPPDMPAYLPAGKKALLTLHLPESKRRWRYADNKTLCFIGNFSHYPNRLAVEYLLTRIAPEIGRLRPDYRLKILGAAAEQVPPECRHGNVHFLGLGNQRTARDLFLNANLMLAPIANEFGQKFKISEAVSYGLPFLASPQALMGHPYLSELPRAPLESPRETVEMIVDLLDNPPKLIALSDQISALHRAFVENQKHACRRCFFENRPNQPDAPLPAPSAA